ncbi:ABC transporter C family member 3 isoform X3 [Lactuca sativa]|uniref:ABC transporter C family member 3 isoform X3 n=1 Tax=Lactuca sativa TaxID=4236 RepID=UPI001C687B85|nr:ABC transporter C family member 3 isoform X3 [Lactuca sativa]
MFYNSPMNTATDFLLSPVFLHGCVASIQFLFLLFILISWVWKRFRIDRSQTVVAKRSFGYLCFKQTLFCSLVLSLFNLVLCFLNNFYWYRNGWTYEKIVTLLHAVLGTLIWLFVSVYLHTLVSNSSTQSSKYPFVLRVWWVFFFTVSCYSLVVDYIHYRKTHNLPSMFFVSDSVSSLLGLFLCFVGLSHKSQEEGQSHNLEEPLLNSSSDRVRGESEIPSTYQNASFFNLLTFSWMSSVISKGNKKPLDLEDVPQLADMDSVKHVFPILLEKVQSLSNGNNQITTFGLTKALIYIIWKEVVITGFLALASSLLSFVGPYLIDTFVRYLNGQKDYKYQGFILVATFFVSKVVGCFTQRHWWFKLQQAGIRARSALVAMIYQKGLTISGQSKQGNSSGEMINLMAVDAERVAFYAWHMHDFWLLLVQVGVALALLYKNLGLAAIASLVATIFVLLANLPLGNIQEKIQDDLMKSKDNRMKATSEILRNMRILKLQGWEMKFLSKIIKLRDEEESALKKYMYTLSLTSFIFWGAPIVVAVVTFATCLFFGIPLESGKVLSALATFKILQEPIYNIPDSISAFFQTKVSLNRIATHLRLTDIDSNAIDKLPPGSSDVAVEIINGNFAWDANASSSNLTLKDINIRVNHGMRVAVCGTVGSGKSSLLSCILGEVSKISGSVKVEGTKAYVAQSPWIQSGKIEDNILFGREMDRERYDNVLEACSLKKDLEILSFGDQTVIGERGINLSGGQKQRIQIARALYQDADIYLFDDPFSAVDAHTGSHLFKECMLQFLDSKTVIYITHQVEFLPAADLIFVLKDGRITQAGKYNDILNSGSDFMDLVGAHKEALSAIDSMETNVQEGTTSSKKNTNDTQNSKTDDISGSKAQLVQEEEREKGKVGFSVYWKYINTAYGGTLAPFIVLAEILFQILQIGSSYWMTWGSPVSESDPAPVTGSTLIMVYVVLSVGCALCILARGLLLATFAYKAATLVFHKMHFSIFRSPMSFFDSTPSGRILNRVIFIFVPVGIMCIRLKQYYLPSAREMSRLFGVCKGPLIQNFAETISGSTTIRSFDQQGRFQDTNLKLNDDFARPKFHAIAAREWLGIRLDMLSSFTFAVFLIFLISIPEGTIDPSIAGLAAIYGLTLNTLQGLVLWTLTNLENKIISVERIFQYSSIPSEPPLVIESNRPDDQWPSQGEVDIRHLQVRYAPHMPLVLRGLTCTFKGGMKTGIVGRTGSGKSTLIQTLFRLVDPAAGEILIDGINISTIGLHDLRSKLSIIPQDPTMFEGSIRSNLDPLEEYTDDKIWEALDKCQLGDEVRSKIGKLGSSVTENGENWSVGQRQLVCLGRVLLKKTKVLVLDEATASVDTATDGMIQQTLAQHFTDSTVIMIAHRITSVLDSDMVLVLEQGLIDEYDSPTKLLEDKSSSFAKLVAEYSMRSNSSFENLAAR